MQKTFFQKIQGTNGKADDNSYGKASTGYLCQSGVGGFYTSQKGGIFKIVGGKLNN